MLKWELLLDEDDFASLLPDEYAHFRRPILGALTRFLAGLSETHQMAVLADQAALPASATAAERLAALARSCPALHKLGQILARDRRLPVALRRRLQELESLPSSIPLPVLEEILAREIGPLDRLGITLDPPALAEASVAVVVPFRQQPARDMPFPGPLKAQGVFKILKPGIEERLDQELGLMPQIGSFLDECCEEYLLPQFDYQDVFAQVREKLRHEVRLDLEQRHLHQAGLLFQRDAQVHIPALLEPCSPRVTAMERLHGVKVTDHSLACSGAQHRLAVLVASSLVAKPLFNRECPAFFHADPHAGNLLVTEAGRLGILDWSLIGWLGNGEREAMVQILLAALARQPQRLVHLLAGLDEGGRIDLPSLENLVHQGLERLRGVPFPGLTWLMGLLDEAVRLARLRVGPNLLLFRKSLYTLEGVLADIGAGPNLLEEGLFREFFCQFVLEWPRRWLTVPFSREFATRLSTLDLAQAVGNLPWVAARFFLDQLPQLLAPLPRPG